MKLTKILILLLAFWLEPLSASPYFSFKKYQVEDGLSHNTVWCAIQDSYGFIWLGTSDGLNRYDGRGNKVYRNVLNDKFSLENNFVEALIEEDQNIWVGTNSGLYIYDRATDRFSYFDKTTQYGVYVSSEIKKIVKTENGLLWIANLGQGLFIYYPKTEVLTQNSIRPLLSGMFVRVTIRRRCMFLRYRKDCFVSMKTANFCNHIRSHRT